jgi:radical SAM superfamily enzyme YgiQ (UPF0313 family)
LTYIASQLEKQDHTIEILDLGCEKEPKKTVHQSLLTCDAVILNVHTDNYNQSADIARFIRKKNPDIPIIISGHYCTYQPERALFDIPSATISIEGEEEHIINDVINAIDNKAALSKIPGVRYKSNDEIKIGKTPQLIQDLDAIDFPNRRLIEKYNYGKINGINFCRPKFTTMMTSRGCPNRCKFCITNVIHKTFRQRSAENVINELQEIQERNNSVLILDDNFLADIKRAHTIMDRIIQIGFDLDLYIAGARVDNADKDLYKKMKKAGVKMIFYGIESGNQDVLEYYNKKVTLNQIRNTIHLAKKMNFIIIGSFIIGAPIETKKHFLQTMKFSRSLPIDFAFFHPLLYQYGTELWNQAVKSGNIIENGELCYFTDLKNNLGNFTKEEINNYCLQAFKKFYLRPTFMMKEILKFIVRKDYNLIKLGFSLIT